MTVFQSSWLAGVATQFELIQDLVFRKVESHPRVRRPQRVERGFFQFFCPSAELTLTPLEGLMSL